MRPLPPACRLLWLPAALLLLSGSGVSARWATSSYASTTWARSAVAADFDADGQWDVAYGSRAGLNVLLSRGQRVRLAGPAKVTSVVAVDLDRDGDRDLIALSERRRLLIWHNDGAGQFSLQAPRSRSTDVAVEPVAALDDGAVGLTPAQTTGGRTAAGLAKAAGNVHPAEAREWLVSAPAILARGATHVSGSPRSPPPFRS